MDARKGSMWSGIFVGIAATVMGGLILAGVLNVLDARPRLYWFDVHHFQIPNNHQATVTNGGMFVVANSGREAATAVEIVFDRQIETIFISPPIAFDLLQPNENETRLRVASVPSRSRLEIEVWGRSDTRPSEIIFDGDLVRWRGGSRLVPVQHGDIVLTPLLLWALLFITSMLTVGWVVFRELRRRPE
jgi:hypothetical protein